MEEEHTNSVNNLVDHNLRELKLFVLVTVMTKVLSDHGDALGVRLDRVAAARVIVVVIECGDTGGP